MQAERSKIATNKIERKIGNSDMLFLSVFVTGYIGFPFKF